MTQKCRSWSFLGTWRKHRPSWKSGERPVLWLGACCWELVPKTDALQQKVFMFSIGRASLPAPHPVGSKQDQGNNGSAQPPAHSEYRCTSPGVTWGAGAASQHTRCLLVPHDLSCSTLRTAVGWAPMETAQPWGSTLSQGAVINPRCQQSWSLIRNHCYSTTIPALLLAVLPISFNLNYELAPHSCKVTISISLP